MNTGNKGRFSERIKKIIYNKGRKKSFTYNKVLIKKVLLFPLLLIGNNFFPKKTIDGNIYINKDKKVANSKRNIDYNQLRNDLYNDYVSYKKVNIQLNKRINTNSSSNKKQSSNEASLILVSNNKNNTLKKDNNKNKNNIFSSTLFIADSILNISNNTKREGISKKKIFSDINSNEYSILENQFQNNKNSKNNIDLNSKIIADISKYLIKSVNNLDTIESDLYVLSKFDGNTESLDKCREYIAKLHALQNKLYKIRQQFNILKENINFDDILEIDDKVLLDELIEFRDAVNNDVAMQTTDNYKLLNEYKYLYFKIDRVVTDINALEKEVSDRKQRLENANINFSEYEKRVYSYDIIIDETIRNLDRQNEIFAKIADKVSNIDVTKKVQYAYDGFMSVLFNGVKLLGLYMLSPFKKSIPGIAAATVATKITMNNLLNTMHVKKKTRFIYSATDYSFTLSNAINNLSNLDDLINSTLSDIGNVKREFISKFSSYSNDLFKYNNVLKKLNKMEQNMVNNQVKVRVLAEKMRNKKRINDETLVKVRKMNNN